MNALIIEDEKLVALELAASIAEVNSDIKIIGTVGSVKTALRWFEENAEPDLIFADVQLADGVSFRIFEQFNLSCPVIFTTAYNEYAIQAFKVNGIDYLLKPVDWDELRKAITKAQSLIKSKVNLPFDVTKLLGLLNVQGVTKPTFKEHFLGKARNSLIPVQVTDIACFIRDQVNFLVNNAGERFVVDYETMDEIELLLDPDQFYRANRQCIISIGAVKQVKGMANLKLSVGLKEPNHRFNVEISRDKAPAFKKWLEK
ncbi:LytTR family DNA-binding domain-containing protein [Dyadobacter sp. CY326]|uniref:LytR/AlgR family response regulator transcription factor n=1 Tax=Dyadobacter sp. CY326 TaxID=2907300 RepID=UPI001F248CC8|nr:LytTR family DNA-binding domain-containing protein [Dyadobacter sp. CY326]MCE7067078.1 LytTR family DNA-binding domain-containing protein [Dyadobacter sp. CY326]